MGMVPLLNTIWDVLDDLGYRDEEHRNETIKIAQITFAYENGWIIEILKKKGAATTDLLSYRESFKKAKLF
jgi:hypothetical protein